VWVAEGLFYYMDQEAGSALLKTMASASTPDSMLIMTHLNHALFTASQRFINDGEFPTDEKIKTFYSSWKSGMPEDVSGYLASNGWRVESQQLMSEIHKVKSLLSYVCLGVSRYDAVSGGELTV
jgi:O-methyltransferase involved in polyketide biosynthesis